MASLACKSLVVAVAVVLRLCCGGAAASSALVGFGYKLVGADELRLGDGVVGYLELINGTAMYGDDVERLKLVARYQNGGRIQVHIADADTERYEVPQSIVPRDPVPSENRMAHRQLFATRIKLANSGKLLSNANHDLELHYIANPFGFAIVRRSSNEVLFNTSAPALTTTDKPVFNNIVFKDQYLEISSQLPFKSVLYGLGESTRPDGLRLSHNREYTLFASDIGTFRIDIDLYGMFPFVVDVRDGGVTHGVAVMNSNGMDVCYNDSSITFKIIGGVLDFYFLPGPDPLAVVDQLTQLVGRPAAMPYWALGFHQSRFGYENVEQLEAVIKKYAEVKLPVESLWSDIDHMDRYMDFTLDPVNYPVKKLQPFVEKLHKNHQKFIVIVDPGIRIDTNYSTYIRGDKLDIYMKKASGERYIAQVWPGATHLPDFLHPNSLEFWATELAQFHKVVPFDGIWLDMNEPANFCGSPTCYFPKENVKMLCPNIFECCMICHSANLSRWDDPPYKINSAAAHRPLYERTMSMSCEHYGGIRAYDTHNIYGMSEEITTYEALKELTGKRPFVLGRSMFLGAGKYSAHWTGDNGARWEDLQYSVVSILNSGMFGVPMVGADICGFLFMTSEELCIRWTQVGAFYPFSRDHSDSPQELYLWSSVTKIAQSVFSMRYKLLPYLYTLAYASHATGAPIARPLFFAAPHDPQTHNISEQFFLGSHILISPALHPGQDAVIAYFPAGTWYNLFNPAQIIHSNNSYHHLPSPLDTINAHVRGGAIIPMQEMALTTFEARRTPYTLLIAMDDQPDAALAVACASGELFVDDDDEILMEVKNGSGTFVRFDATRSRSGEYALRSDVREGGYAVEQGLMLQKVIVLGVRAAKAQVSHFSVKVNGESFENANVAFDEDASALHLTNLNLPIGKSFNLTWDDSGRLECWRARNACDAPGPCFTQNL